MFPESNDSEEAEVKSTKVTRKDLVTTSLCDWDERHYELAKENFGELFLTENWITNKIVPQVLEITMKICIRISAWCTVSLP